MALISLNFCFPDEHNPVLQRNQNKIINL